MVGTEVTAAGIELARDTARRVPAYREFLAGHGMDPDRLADDDWSRLPLVTKPDYLARYPLARRCQDGELTGCDMIAVSSGSSGAPRIWPRSAADERHATAAMRRIMVDTFGADRRATLAVVCFPMGSWVGGLYTLSCLRSLVRDGDARIITVAPGNNVKEILRVLPELAPTLEQTVLLGYPPFVKEVIDSGRRAGIPWSEWDLKLVFAGETFSERWRDLVTERCGIADPAIATAAMYGTADAGILAVESPLTVGVRRLAAAHPELANDLFGTDTLPTLAQYDPARRLFECLDGDLVFSTSGTMPLVRYAIGDRGGLLDSAEVLARCAEYGWSQPAGYDELPMVYLFGRTLFSVSYFGANVYPENVAPVLERPEFADTVTGRFVLQVREFDEEPHLFAVVELAPGAPPSPGLADRVSEAMGTRLTEINSEYGQYGSPGRRTPRVEPRTYQDPEWFPVGVKHRYTR